MTKYKINSLFKLLECLNKYVYPTPEILLFRVSSQEFYGSFDEEPDNLDLATQGHTQTFFLVGLGRWEGSEKTIPLL